MEEAKLSLYAGQFDECWQQLREHIQYQTAAQTVALDGWDECLQILVLLIHQSPHSVPADQLVRLLIDCFAIPQRTDEEQTSSTSWTTRIPSHRLCQLINASLQNPIDSRSQHAHTILSEWLSQLPQDFKNRVRDESMQSKEEIKSHERQIYSTNLQTFIIKVLVPHGADNQLLKETLDTHGYCLTSAQMKAVEEAMAAERIDDKSQKQEGRVAGTTAGEQLQKVKKLFRKSWDTLNQIILTPTRRSDMRLNAVLGFSSALLAVLVFRYAFGRRRRVIQ